MVLVFSISNFFTNKIPREGNWVRFSCSNSALIQRQRKVHMNHCVTIVRWFHDNRLPWKLKLEKKGHTWIEKDNDGKCPIVHFFTYRYIFLNERRVSKLSTSKILNITQLSKIETMLYQLFFVGTKSECHFTFQGWGNFEENAHYLENHNKYVSRYVWGRKLRFLFVWRG